MAPLERLKILMQVQGKERVYRGVVQVRQAGVTGAPSQGRVARHMLKLCDLLGVVQAAGPLHCFVLLVVAEEAARRVLRPCDKMVGMVLRLLALGNFQAYGSTAARTVT